MPACRHAERYSPFPPGKAQKQFGSSHTLKLRTPSATPRGPRPRSTMLLPVNRAAPREAVDADTLRQTRRVAHRVVGGYSAGNGRVVGG